MELTLERAKELLVIMIDDMKKDTHPPIEDVINYLFVLGFAEEELLELGVCTEVEIDNANAKATE